MGDAFGAFRATFGGATLLRLTRNYRSGGHVVAAARAVVAANARRVDKRLWTSRAAGARVAVIRVEGGPGAEARHAARWVADALAADAALRPRDVAVLCRSAAPALRAVERELVRRDVKCAVVGAHAFADRPPVRLALAYLRLVLNECDDDAARCALLARRGVGPKAVEALEARGLPLVGACRDPPARWGTADARRAADAVLALLDAAWAALRGRAPVRSALAVLEAAVLEAADDRDAAVTLLNQLKRVAAAREADAAAAGAAGPEALRAFLDSAALAPAEAEGADGGGVTLCTIHKAKGLEWPRVLLVRANDGVLPATHRDDGAALAGAARSPDKVRRRGADDHADEERRLFHVAITCARDAFAASSARRRRFARGEGGAPRRPPAQVLDAPARRAVGRRRAGRGRRGAALALPRPPPRGRRRPPDRRRRRRRRRRPAAPRALAAAARRRPRAPRPAARPLRRARRPRAARGRRLRDRRRRVPPRRARARRRRRRRAARARQQPSRRVRAGGSR